MSYDATIHAKAIDLTKLCYQMTNDSGSGHPTSGASLSHLIAVLMYDVMRFEPANPAHPSSDRLILSEGHAVPVVYAACADIGVHIAKTFEERYNATPGNTRAMTRDDLKTLRELESVVDGHPNPVEGFPFFDSATGSLGQGLSCAAGLALADRLDGIGKRFYCLIGDGESREGQIWEAIEFMVDHNIKACLPIFNCNEYAQSDVVSSCQTADTTAAKLEAVGITPLLIDGHNPTHIKQALEKHIEVMGDPNAHPVAIVAKTVKGWGAASQQGHGHHGSPAKGDALDAVMKELDATAMKIGASAIAPLKRDLLPSEKPAAAQTQAAPSFEDALKQFGMESVLEKGKMATRKAYAVGLRALGHAHSGVVSLDADVKNSTGADAFFKDEKLAERAFDCRIAEQNMIGAALGFAAGGKVPFASTFGKFFTRAFDQIEMSAINSGGNIKLVGSHAGISLGADGPSQMAVNDVAFFRGFTTVQRHDNKPGMYVITPSDAYQAYQLLFRMAEYDGPCYMRTLRPDTEFLYSANDNFTLGGHEVLNTGEDLLIIASGYMVHQANAAIDKLDEQGISAGLVDLYSLPFDGDAILDLANQHNGMVLTLEDNYGNSMGSAVADVVAEDGGGFTVKQMHVTNLPKSARSEDDIMRYCGLSVDHIVEAAQELVELTPA